MFTNEVLWAIGLVLDLAAILALLRLFGKDALVSVITFNLILCNIQVLKTIELFGSIATLGDVAFGSVFLATDILGEIYGAKEARRALWLGFANFFVFTLMIQLSLVFIPQVPGSDSMMHEMFAASPRIFMASIAAAFISQNISISLFHYISDKTAKKYLWLRNNVATMSAQIIDSAIFTLGVFAPILPMNEVVALIGTTVMIKWLVAILDTPFIYWGRKILQRKEIDLLRANI